MSSRKGRASGECFPFPGNKKQQDVIIMARAAVLSSSPLTLPLLPFCDPERLCPTAESRLPNITIKTQPPAHGNKCAGKRNSLDRRKKQKLEGNCRETKRMFLRTLSKNTEVKDVDTSTQKALLVLFHDTDISFVSFFPFSACAFTLTGSFVGKPPSSCR